MLAVLEDEGLEEGRHKVTRLSWGAWTLTDATGERLEIGSLTLDQVAARKITVGDHCYACTAGSGSSCGGALV